LFQPRNFTSLFGFTIRPFRCFCSSSLCPPVFQFLPLLFFFVTLSSGSCYELLLQQQHQTCYIRGRGVSPDAFAAVRYARGLQLVDAAAAGSVVGVHARAGQREGFQHLFDVPVPKRRIRQLQNKSTRIRPSAAEEQLLM
jgi:hypothetical protein